MNILKIALMVSILGLLILFYLSNYFLPKKISIEEIEKKNLDEWVIVEGKVRNIKNYDGLTLINLCDKKCINIVVFDKIEIEINEKIKVVGKIKIYRGIKEIQAEKIEYA